MNAARRRALRVYRTTNRFVDRAVLILTVMRMPDPDPWQAAYTARLLWEIGQKRRLTTRQRRNVRRLDSTRKHRKP